jgi:hypothetical protein
LEREQLSSEFTLQRAATEGNTLKRERGTFIQRKRNTNPIHCFVPMAARQEGFEIGNLRLQQEGLEIENLKFEKQPSISNLQSPISNLYSLLATAFGASFFTV